MSLSARTWKKYPEFENLLKASGYKRPTLLQELVLPPILDKRDVIVESGLHPGKTLSIVTSVILKNVTCGVGISVLILTKAPEQAQKLFRTFSHALRPFLAGCSVISIGFSDLIKKESRQLSEKPEIVISTPSRLIDHIRRDNIDLSSVEQVFIDEEEEYEQAFENDLCFIFSKLRGSLQIVRFSFARETKYGNIDKLMKRPVTIQERDFSHGHGAIQYTYLTGAKLDKLLFRLILSLDFECVIVVDPLGLGKKLLSALQSMRLEGIQLPRETNPSRIEKAIDCAGSEHLDVIITVPDTLPFINLEGISHIIFYGEPTGELVMSKVVNVAQVGQTSLECIMLTTPQNEAQFLSKQEQQNVKIEKKDMPTDENVIKATVKRLFKKSEASGKLEDFASLEKNVRKAVPFGRRAFFISYLLQENLRASLTKDLEFVTLFLNIGHTRGAAAKEISSLFQSKLSLDKSMIKDIRVFDNYSFVEIVKDVAESAIKDLNNTDYKGKKLIVNFSRQKAERRDFAPRRGRRP